jgi:hypothetical protein
MSERIERWLKAHHEASDKMDYFMLGVVVNFFRTPKSLITHAAWRSY